MGDYAKAFIIALSVIIAVVSSPANAAWLMTSEDNAGEQLQCPESFYIANIKVGADEFIACVPEDVEPEPAPVESPPAEQEKTPHTGPYEGTPQQGPLFN